MQDSEGAIRAAKQNLDTAETLLRSSEELFRNGRATLPDVENAKAGSARARYELAQTKAMLDHTRIALTNAVGVEPSARLEIEPQSEKALTPDLEESVEGLIAEARLRRPDLFAAHAEVAARVEGIDMARAAHLPSANVKADAGQTAVWPTADYGNLGSANVTTWHLTAEIRWSLLDASRKHRIAEARAFLVDAQQNLRLVDDALSRQVWDAYTDFKTAVEQLHDAEQFLASADISYQSSTEAYGYGVRSLVDVVQSEETLEQARFAVVHSRTIVLKAAASVDYSVGSRILDPAKQRGVAP